VPGELARDSGSMPLGTSLQRWSHLGSNRTGDNEDRCIGDCHQGSRLTCIPHVLPMVVFLMNPLAAWRARYSETRRTLSTLYTGISFCMCQHPRGELIGHRTYLETK
jgi:hypothetical protein